MSNQGSGIIFLNDRNEVLLLLRDDIQTIPYPNMWDLPGGQVEADETPEQTIKREMKEELGIVDVGDIIFYKSYSNNNLIDNVFWKKANMDVNSITLKEGQKLKYFSIDEIRKMKLAFDYQILLDEFFREVLRYE